MITLREVQIVARYSLSLLFSVGRPFFLLQKMKPFISLSSDSTPKYGKKSEGTNLFFVIVMNIFLSFVRYIHLNSLQAKLVKNRINISGLTTTIA